MFKFTGTREAEFKWDIFTTKNVKHIHTHTRTIHTTWHPRLSVGRAVEKVFLYKSALGQLFSKEKCVSVKKFNIMHDRAIPLLRIYSEKIITDVNNVPWNTVLIMKNIKHVSVSYIMAHPPNDTEYTD